jgi:phage RecT family recombinase
VSESTAVTKSSRKDLQSTLERYAPKLAVFGVRPEAYIEAALMAAVKTPELLKCTPESVALALRQCAQTGLEIGRTAHLMPFGQTCTFVPDYKGLIELACSTGKVASIRTRSVFEGEEFAYYEDIGGPVLKHVPRLTGSGGVIVGAYAIADLRFNRFKVEWMTAAEIDAIRHAKSKSWKNGPLVDWYARKTVVRKLCKTLPSNARLQQALTHDDTDDGIEDAEFVVADAPKPIVSGATRGAVVTADPYGFGDDMPTPEQAVANARRALAAPDPYAVEELPGSNAILEDVA